MEPDKYYPLHPDQNDQSPMPSAPPVDPAATPLTPPSSFDATTPDATTKPAVPWYLQPLTKTTQSPLTTTQTRPYVPREPVTPGVQPALATDFQPTSAHTAPQPQAPSDTPPRPPEYPNTFGAQPLPPLRPSSDSSPYGQPAHPQQSVAPAIPRAPKPFSQYSATPARGATSQSQTGAPKKSKKLLPIVLISLALLFIFGSVFGAYALWQKSRNEQPVAVQSDERTREERLHNAIAQQLQTKYIGQSYEQVVEGESKDTISLDTSSDFTQPSTPKSRINYTFESGGSDDAIKGAGEIIVTDAPEYYAKLSAPALFYEGTDADRPKENQWYSVAPNDGVGELAFDPLMIRSGLNSPFGEMPIGNFDEPTRKELMQFITGRNVYAIKESKEATEDGKKITHYTIAFNAALVNELNQKIATAIGRENDESVANFAEGDIKDMQLWVDNQSGRLTRMQLTREYGNEGNARPVKETINVSYKSLNEQPDIAKPDGTTAAPWAE